MSSKWQCPVCQSHDVQISLPAWYREDKDGSLTYVNCDAEADIMHWYCESCCESGRGGPVSVEEG